MTTQRNFTPDLNAVPFKGNAAVVVAELDAADLPKGGVSMGVLNTDLTLNMNITETKIPDTFSDQRGTWRTFTDSIDPVVAGTLKAVAPEFWPSAFKGTLSLDAGASETDEVVRIYPCGGKDRIYTLKKGLVASAATFTSYDGVTTYAQPSDVKLNATHPSFVVVSGGALDVAATAAVDGYVQIKVDYTYGAYKLVTPVDATGKTYQLQLHGVNLRNSSAPWFLIAHKVDWSVIANLALVSDAEADIPVSWTLLSNSYQVSLGLNAYFDYRIS